MAVSKRLRYEVLRRDTGRSGTGRSVRVRI